jgi:polar amino acid transport system permease protein
MSYHFDWSVLWAYRFDLLTGVFLTIELSVAAIVISLFIGAFVGVMRTTSSILAQDLSYLYIEVMRNIPPIVKVFFLYFATGLDAFSATLLGITIHQSAYIAEAVKAGIQSLAVGQSESAAASGLSAFQTIRYIMLPQAIRIVAPPIASNFIEIIKNSSIGVTVGLAELTYQAKAINAETFRGFEAATAITLIYLCMTLLVPLTMRLFQSRLRYDI